MSSSRRSVDQKSVSSEDAKIASNPTSTVFGYADFVFSSNKRSTGAELFASLVWRTRHDLTEASRLYLSPTVSNFLESWPDRKAWIDKVLSNTRVALIDIGTCIESVRSNRDDDGISRMKRKFDYTLSHQKRIAHRQQTLANTHQVLLGAIQVMQTVEQCAGLGGSVPDPIFEAPVRPWLRSDSEIVRAPYSRRKSSRNLSALSVASSELSDKYEMGRTEVLPAELHGSMPGDLMNTSVLDVPRHTRTQRSQSIIERTQSIASTTASIRIPVLAKRYRPRPVDIQKLHLTHHSFPSNMPPYQSQPSLEDDLRDWMIQTAASDHPPEMELIRSPTISSTTGSIASRHEMMQVLASISNIEEVDPGLASSDSVTQGYSIVEDDAINCPLPPSAPNSPPMASESTNTPDDTTLISSFPLPPLKSGSLPVASGPIPSQQDTTSAVTSLPPPPQADLVTVASEAAQTQEGGQPNMHPREDTTLATSLPLPLSQPDSTLLPSEVPFQPQCSTIVPQYGSVLKRKPLPPTTADNKLSQCSPAPSPRPLHLEQLTEDSTTPMSPPDIQSTIRTSEPPR
ncbi:uncharacterized protein M421DRAFT_391868 [Didymella exigua CBS 183.55]|uniref:Uncharacterized protein n=1 Tax=Didymella exigua CBS 183.55 TaxID=1150837 RepID=A0A6A5RK79_9PLEO|nr:uncharacterized protein M421DRAFT_391868 [Didymella exigua CBS 183.55]KAF1928222.1 hypothetical protein M421DRAFT_391868 [Didymella exigua CBS 183.55]